MEVDPAMCLLRQAKQREDCEDGILINLEQSSGLSENWLYNYSLLLKVN